MKTLKIGKHAIGKGVFIIAEAGVNHNGRLDLALKLVDAAAECGADAIKFQTFRAPELVTSAGKMAAYQKRNTGKNESQLSMLRKLELRESLYAPIIARCKKRNILFLSAAHGGFASVDLLAALGVPAFKFSSADLTNLPVLSHAARYKKPMIISTGMATMQEIEEAVRAIKKEGNDKIIILQCTTDYPTDPKEVNLRAMQTIARRLGTHVGFSDHTSGMQAAIMAATLGACVIEKHLTLDKHMQGPDHAASENPREFRKFVDAIRLVEPLLGSRTKKPTVSEKKYIPLVRKSIVANCSIKKGELFTRDSIAIKRPGTGLHPRFFSRFLGKKAKRNIEKDAPLLRSDI
ncbi:N-acetylneuraminate synthase [Candidatus Kaiserbacteria bacterium]|nr:N-acetylneuraminate synthase [Candidatus Kaiserbacteria bacterium]